MHVHVSTNISKLIFLYVIKTLENLNDNSSKSDYFSRVIIAFKEINKLCMPVKPLKGVKK